MARARTSLRAYRDANLNPLATGASTSLVSLLYCGIVINPSIRQGDRSWSREGGGRGWRGPSTRASLCVCVCVRVCLRECVRVCVRARRRARVCDCVHKRLSLSPPLLSHSLSLPSLPPSLCTKQDGVGCWIGGCGCGGVECVKGDGWWRGVAGFNAHRLLCQEVRERGLRLVGRERQGRRGRGREGEGGEWVRRCGGTLEVLRACVAYPMHPIGYGSIFLVHIRCISDWRFRASGVVRV
jgi:hypothetical protein